MYNLTTILPPITFHLAKKLNFKLNLTDQTEAFIIIIFVPGETKQQYLWLGTFWVNSKGPFTNTCKGGLMQTIFIVKIYCFPPSELTKFQPPFLP